VVALASAALTGTVIGVVALGPLYGGFAVVGLRAASGRRVEMNDFFLGFARWKPLVVVGLLMGLFVTLGTALLVIPGLYLAMALSYAPFLVVDRGTAPWTAIKDSIAAVNSQLGAHVVVWLALAAVAVAGALCCGVGVLVAIPLTAVTVGVCYGRLFGFAGGVDRLERT
jgi:uncharacterized membrane protein